MAKNKEEKTNVMRALEQKKIAYTAHSYPHEEGVAVDGVTVAKSMGFDPAQVFKTLVARGASGQYYVFDVPVAESLDLKKAARAVGEKSIEAAYPLTIGHRFGMQPFQIMEQPIRVAVAQRQIIENFAKQGDCVIVGRAADVILKDYDPLNIFVYADKDSKIERCQRRAPQGEHLTPREIESHMKQIDRNRAQHHQMYSDSKWGDKGSYDLCINTTKRFVKDIVPSIAKFCEDWFNSHG